MNIFILSLNLLRRDWRAGEWRVLLLALVLAVGSLSTVGLFADRVRQVLQQQAQSLIGADLRINSTRPFSAEYRALAEAQGVQVVESRSFPSMVSFDGHTLLSEIQAVGAGYPLRGKIETDEGESAKISPSPQPSGEITSQLTKPASGQVAGYPIKGEGGTIPQPGTLWADERLLRRLNLKIGDEVGLGERHFVVSKRIVKDIDQSLGFASFAPRVLMNDADLASTGLLQPGSRISYRMMFAGEPKQVNALRQVLKKKLSSNEKLEDVRDARPEIRIALERAEHFLGLAALSAAILAGVALALAARRFVERHLDGCAVMRCLGAQQGQVLRLFLYQFVLLGLLGVALGGVLGYATQAVLVDSITAMREANLPQPGWLPLVQALLSGFALLLGFAFLPLLQLRKVSPLRVLRRELGLPQASAWLVYGLAVLVLAALFLWQAGSLKLGLAVLGGLVLGLLLFGGFAWLLLRALARCTPLLNARWRHVLNQLARQGSNAPVQVVALSLGGMALLVLTLVRGDLLASWQDKLPPDAPNRFVVNIQPDQLQPLTDFFSVHNLPVPQWQPMIRGRLVAINDKPVNGDDYPEPRARALVEREFNLSYMDQLPDWNKVIAGQWRQNEKNSWSVEEGIAQTLGIHLGDTLTYDVAGSRCSGKVSSLRKLQWDSMKVNFFVIATPEMLQDFPATYIASFYLPPDKVRAGDELSAQFPNLLLIDTGVMIDQVRSIISQIAQAASAVFLFTLLSGFAVLYAALLATQDVRMHETAILRTLGADSAYLRRMHLFEFALLGGLSGLFAAAGATLLGWVLAHDVLDIPYQAGFAVWIVGVVVGIAVVTVAGWLATRRMVQLSPLRILASD